ncbi:sensor domain-containing diguanylate cyclase [Clostridium grantii]|uniref:Diguanylate cyclase (GGDEF) domain-containing protein n=1 Tax=Clostridium grantii DSM 8605 TaxID=1121316 RepID=A0A1M5UXI3_9CLOT|nr:diguanylate cyclase [Clostridium grantii]SHH67702.1 diguanylate cyclase (GGDEF) domain-containing protein [Clostridium grantii DSM 8605]
MNTLSGLIKRHKLKISLTAVLIVFLVFILAAYPIKSKTRLTVVNGNIDLSSFDFKNNVKLNGQWKLYPYKLLSYEEIINIDDYEGINIKVPSLWTGVEYGSSIMEGRAFGTYVLKVQLPEGNKDLSLEIRDICSAYKLYIDDDLMIENGKVTTSKEEFIASYKPNLINFYTNETEINIIIQVANFSQLDGGIWDSIYIGTSYNIINKALKDHILDYFIIGGLVLMGIYHLVYFIFKNQWKEYLFFSLFAITIALRNIVTRSRSIYLIFPNIKWIFVTKLEYLTIYLAFLFCNMYVYHIYKEVYNRRIYKVIKILFILAILLHLFLPTSITQKYLNVFLIMSALLCLYILNVLFKTYKNQKEGAFTFIVGMFIIFLCFINDALVTIEVLETSFLVPIGVFIFIVIQSIATGRLFTNAFKNLEIYANENRKMYVEIKNLNETLELKVKERTNELKNKNMELKELACIDSLTGILNHRNIVNYLQTSIDNIDEYKFLSVSMMDIDYFKRINDSYGHQMGDRVLEKIVELIKNTLNKKGIVGRYGGEEFLIVMPRLGIYEAFKLIEKIRVNVENLKIEGIKDKVTISAGICECTVNSNVSDIIDRCDELLYKAKDLGRNRTEF